ncbi:cytochrome P450 [Histoplasma capsulatum var. duboisii H88]|uniref:Cytochrome P450 n=1 Tax=Ajellomyces capsulatus (strain H88) TaxID=544711 RepID=A0A8A1LGV6_AJEC8|nr:cytochrome P450 [Histoplasma capsulatum var. duboisii H88]
MVFTVFSVGITLSLSFFIYKLVSLVRHYIQARRSGLPIFISPVLSKSIPWMVLGPYLQPFFRKHLPALLYDRLDIVTHGWEYRRGREFHERLGNIFALVTPDECLIWVADPAVGASILQRRNDFPQAPIVAKILGLYGPNVFSANGEEWKRHRRMFAANLDERISKTVWTESCRHASEMIKYMLKNPGNKTLDGLRSIAINVIGQAGFNQSGVWAPTMRNRTGKATTGKAAFWETFSLTTEMLLEGAFLPTKVMRLPFMPPTLRLMGYHMERAPIYMKEVLDEERKALENATGRRNNFLSFLLKLSDEEKNSGENGFSLADDEISGNLFVFSTAGFETTSNTMGYAVAHLAVYPELQDWIREELRTLDPDPSKWKYEEVFPKCRRTLALMFEILRFFPPVLHSNRSVFKPQQIVDGNRTRLLTPPMDILISQLSMHLDPTIWGADVNEFRPSRWIDESGQLITPPKGAYIPWSSGPRICPGIKMSQVEFVATLTTLFRSARCDPLPTAGIEEPEALRQRLLRVTLDSVSKLSLQIRHANEVHLRWTAV